MSAHLWFEQHKYVCGCRNSKLKSSADLESRTLRADDEVSDPKKYLEDGCTPKCVKQLYAYQACAKRVESDETGHKHCTGQYFDYWSCVDQCVAPKVFTKLK